MYGVPMFDEGDDPIQDSYIASNMDYMYSTDDNA